MQLAAIRQNHDEKVWKIPKTFFVKTKTKTKTLFFVLEAPRDQNLGLEDDSTDCTSLTHMHEGIEAV